MKTDTYIIYEMENFLLFSLTIHLSNIIANFLFENQCFLEQVLYCVCIIVCMCRWKHTVTGCNIYNSEEFYFSGM
jgi:hypothetical protein